MIDLSTNPHAASALAAPDSADPILTGTRFAIVYWSEFAATGFWGIPSFDFAGKKQMTEDRAAELFDELLAKYYAAQQNVEYMTADGNEPPAESVYWSKMRPIAVHGEMHGSTIGSTFTCVFEASSNPLPVLAIIALVGFIASAVIAVAVSNADIDVETELKFEGLEQLHESIKELTAPAPGSPLGKVAQSFETLALAVLVIGGLLLIPKALK